MPQLSQSGRLLTAVIYKGGYVYYFLPGDTAATLATNNTGEDPPLNPSGLIYSATNNQRIYICDGVNYCYFAPSDNSVNLWEATAGGMPEDSEGNVGRLICTWRGRTVIAGLEGEPHNIYFSAVGVPTDFNTSPDNPSPTMAVALNASPLGLIGDVVTSICPFSDDVLIIFGDHSIYLLRGDPADGGRLDLVTNTIGAVWGRPWCMGPDGSVYFFSNKMGIYRFLPGAAPQRISQPIDNLLADVDTGTNGITMAWDDARQAVVVHITPLEEAAAATHYTYESRPMAWFQRVYANPDHNPLCCITLDGNLPDDRVVVIGSWDGYLRALSADNPTDDGIPIASSVIIGPVLNSVGDDMMLHEIQAVLAHASGAVTCEVLTGETAEIALASDPVETFEWAQDRNFTELVRVSGHALYLRLSSSEQWAMESIRMLVSTTGDLRRRGL